MSRFLGPIHHWLHGKITSQERFEIAVMSQIENAGYSLDAIADADAKYGSPTPDEVLENVIDGNNIHGWLQQRISQSETRFAYKLTQLEAVHGEVMTQIASDVFSNEGKQYADLIKADQYWDGTLQSAHKLLHNLVLEGMPCDQAGAITQNEAQQLVWQNNRCLHSQYWQAVNGNPEAHYTLRDALSKSFFETLGEIQYTHHHVNDQHQYSIQL